MKRTALVIRNPACNSEMTLSPNYLHLQGRDFQCLVTFSGLGKYEKCIYDLLLQFLPPLSWLRSSASLNCSRYTQSQLHEWAWPQLPVDGCKFFTFIDKTWLFSRTKAWNETHQDDRDGVFQHHWLYSEPLIIQCCHRPWQSHFQAPPKKQKTAWNFSNKDPNPSLSLDINLLAEHCAQPMLWGMAVKREANIHNKSVALAMVNLQCCQANSSGPLTHLTGRQQQGHKQLGRHCALHLTHLTLSIIGVFNTRKRR